MSERYDKLITKVTTPQAKTFSHPTKKVENTSVPSAGVTPHPRKSDGKNRTEPVSQPNSHLTIRDQKRDNNTSDSSGSTAEVPRERLHLEKHNVEPTAKGKTTKVAPSKT